MEATIAACAGSGARSLRLGYHRATLPRKLQEKVPPASQLLVPQAPLGCGHITPLLLLSLCARLPCLCLKFSLPFSIGTPMLDSGPPNPGSSHLCPYLDDVCRYLTST